MKRALVALASIITVAIIVVVALIFLRVFRIPFFVVEVFGASHSAVHWIGWTGALYIAFVTPIYPIVKRKFPQHLNRMLNVHAIGNLVAVLLVSIHFAHQVTRPADRYPDLGTGIVLYAAMVLLVATGLILASGIGGRYYKSIRFLHPALALTFYLAIVMHIIHGI